MTTNRIQLSGIHETSPLLKSSTTVQDLAMDILRKKEAWLSAQMKERLPLKVWEQVKENPGRAKYLLEKLNMRIVEHPNGLTELFQDKIKLSEFKVVFKPLTN